MYLVPLSLTKWEVTRILWSCSRLTFVVESHFRCGRGKWQRQNNQGKFHQVLYLNVYSPALLQQSFWSSNMKASLKFLFLLRGVKSDGGHLRYLARYVRSYFSKCFFNCTHPFTISPFVIGCCSWSDWYETQSSVIPK